VNRLLALADARWPGVLDPGAATRLAGPELARCAGALRSVRLLGEDLVGLDAIFEFIVNKAAKGQKGQYFTPRHVIAEIIAMVEPAPGERLVDPACGSGGFLRHALLREPRCAAWGFDQDPRACRVARVMMAASGQPAGRVARGDSLRRPGVGGPSIETCMESMDISFAGFDVVVTNPPFAGDVGEDHARAYELARGHRAERDVLFIERCVELLRPGGRLAMVLPHNKVTGSPWRRARRWMLERLRVVAVLGLGRNTFRPHTSQKACVLLGIKRATPVENFGEEEVLFFISEEDGKDRRGRLVRGADGRSVAHDLPEATPLVQQRFRGLRGRAPGHEGPAGVAGGLRGLRGG
jgi:type I restriction enzyme M protein